MSNRNPVRDTLEIVCLFGIKKITENEIRIFSFSWDLPNTKQESV
jgi:hypothetical protein